METTIERLRVQKAEFERQQSEAKRAAAKVATIERKQGRAAGDKWAREAASYSQLMTLAELNRRPEYIQRSIDECRAIIYQQGLRNTDRAFVEGFLKGALEVWDEIRDEL